MRMDLQFFHSRTQKLGKENCPYLKPVWCPAISLRNLKLRELIQKQFWASRTEIPKGKNGQRKHVSAWDTLGWSSTKKSKYLLGNIFTAWYVMLESPHSECLYPKADLVHGCASCCQWVTCRIWHSITLLGKGENAVYPGQDYCNDIIWANNPKCCAWSSG